MYAGLHTVDNVLGERRARIPEHANGNFITLGAQTHELIEKIQAIFGAKFSDRQFLQRPEKWRGRLTVYHTGKVGELKVCEVREVVDEDDEPGSCDTATP